MATEIMPAVVNCTLRNGLAIYQNADWILRIRINNSTDNPFDLTGYEGKCAIKEHTGDDIPIAMPSVNIIDAKDGVFELYLPNEETAKFKCDGQSFREVNVYEYDVYFMKGDNSYRALMGRIEVSPTVFQDDDN